MQRGIQFTAIISLFMGLAQAQITDYSPESLRRIDVVEQSGAQVPLDIHLTDSRGERVRLGDYLDGYRPVVLSLAYYECPMLCTLVLNGLAKSTSGLDWTAGEQYRMITVSIDPTETAELARGKEETYLASLEGPHTEAAWRFNVAEEGDIRRLAESLGFVYYYDVEKDEYAHPAVLMVLTPTGRISRYLYGLEPTPQDLKLALLEASEGKIGNTLDRLLLYCYHYDSEAGGYSIQAANVMRLGGMATVLVLSVFFALLFLRERAAKRRAPVTEKKE